MLLAVPNTENCIGLTLEGLNEIVYRPCIAYLSGQLLLRNPPP
jgi:hypothetical protein